MEVGRFTTELHIKNCAFVCVLLLKSEQEYGSVTTASHERLHFCRTGLADRDSPLHSVHMFYL